MLSRGLSEVLCRKSLGTAHPGCGGISVGAQLLVIRPLGVLRGGAAGLLWLSVAAVTLSPAGEHGLLHLRHHCDGNHQFSDVDIL